MKNLLKLQCPLRRILSVVLSLFVILLLFTVYANIRVERAARGRIYSDLGSVPYNRVALLLGTNPMNRLGRPNTYFTNRIKTAAGLYQAGKVDYIIVSGDNHTKKYDETSAMRDSLIAHGVPAERIVPDYAGFRTLDSVVRAKEIFGCDSITIVSQSDHSARALYLAKANGINAVAAVAPLQAGPWVRTRLALREWLARDKMMFDIWFGKRPHFLGEKIAIPEIPAQKSYSTCPGMSMRIADIDNLRLPVDSIVVEFVNDTVVDGHYGEWFRLEQKVNGRWAEVPVDTNLFDVNGELNIIFNSIAYILEAGTVSRHTVRPWFYESLGPGEYRLSKTMDFPPYPRENSDTAYVEFHIRP